MKIPKPPTNDWSTYTMGQITVSGWGPFEPPTQGDVLRVERTGELIHVLDVSEDGLTLTIARIT